MTRSGALTEPPGLSLDRAGVPRAPLHVLDLDLLDAAPQSRIDRLARAVRWTPQVVVGIARRPTAPRLDELVGGLAFKLEEGVGTAAREAVAVSDLDAALAHLRGCVEARPQASIALVNLLRQSDSDPYAGLASEAAVYSMLLGGSEFGRWLESRGSPHPAGEPGRVVVTESEGVAGIVLDRPQMHNAMNVVMREALNDALLALALGHYSEIALSGRGPSFCSGGDLAEFGLADDLVAAYMVRLERAPWRAMQAIGDRVQVRVHGATIGAGLELAAFAASFSAAPGTAFRLPEVSMGLVPGAGGTISVPNRIGRWRACWMMLTGASIGVETALGWGLVDAIESAA